MSDKSSLSASISPGGPETPYAELPPDSPSSELASTLRPAAPPSFSSLFSLGANPSESFRAILAEPDPPPEFCPGPPVAATYNTATTVEKETKAALPSDTKGEPSNKAAEDREPPPPYTEGSSPLDSFTYVMAAAGGAASIITQVQQGGAQPINTLAGMWRAQLMRNMLIGILLTIFLGLISRCRCRRAHNARLTVQKSYYLQSFFWSNIHHRGTRFVLSRDELLTLPEFVLLSLFPNGLLPDGHMNSFHEGDIYPVDVCYSSPF